MDSAEFITRYPRLYHMAQDGSWPLVQRLGLLSTRALLDSFKVFGEARAAILERRRPTSVTIRAAEHGEAVVRDQLPLNDAVLERVLDDGLSPGDWYRMLNEFVFFWPTEQRLATLLSARAYRNRSHTVLVIDTEALVRDHGDRVRLSPINSGNTLFNARSRGHATFRSIADYPFDEMRGRRGPAGAVAEVAVLNGVTPIEPVLISADRRTGADVIANLWTP